MKLALQTIPWGDRISDLPAVLQGARDLGLQGIEFAQMVHTLPGPEELRRQMGDLVLVGLAGGYMGDRLAYARVARPCYLYTDEWDETPILAALREGIPVGMHPHYYKDIATLRDADRYLDEYPELGLIVDTAHMYLSGEPVVDNIEARLPRVISVHLKDWTSEFGTGPFEFARGFTALGAGELGDVLKATVEMLVRSHYDGWIVVEQDTTVGDPLVEVSASLKWLRALGI